MAFNLPFSDENQDAYIAAYGKNEDKEAWARYVR